MACSNNRKIIIAIDGYSSSGKSTFAREIAARMGYIFIDTGSMYRSVTLYAIENGAVTEGVLDRNKVAGMLDNIEISFRFNPSRGASDVYVNGKNVEKKIRSIEVSDLVSEVSSITQVREKLVAIQQQLGQKRGVVMDGRDIGTVVFPDAELKIFLTADPAVRARRRYEELKAKGEEVPFDEIERNIRERDRADETRAVSPLRKADDALVLDNSSMTLEEQMEWVMSKVDQKLHGQ